MLWGSSGQKLDLNCGNSEENACALEDEVQIFKGDIFVVYEGDIQFFMLFPPV